MNQYIFTFCHDWIDWFGMSCIQVCLFTKRHEKFPVVAFKYACTSRQKKNHWDWRGWGNHLPAQSNTNVENVLFLHYVKLTCSHRCLVKNMQHLFCVFFIKLLPRLVSTLCLAAGWTDTRKDILLTLCRLLSALVANSEGPLLASFDMLCTNMSPFRFVHHWQHWSARPKPIARFSGALPYAC